MITGIEVNFPIPVELSDEFEQELIRLVGVVCDKYEASNPLRVMWPAGMGSKPIWDEPNEPTFDGTIYCIDVAEREAYDEEIQRRSHKKSSTHGSSRVYLEAAKMVLTQGYVYSCGAIYWVNGSEPVHVSRYERLFRPSTDDCDPYWGDTWARSFEERKACRVLALLLMSAIAESEEKERK